MNASGCVQFNQKYLSDKPTVSSSGFPVHVLSEACPRGLEAALLAASCQHRTRKARGCSIYGLPQRKRYRHTQLQHPSATLFRTSSARHTANASPYFVFARH